MPFLFALHVVHDGLSDRLLMPMASETQAGPSFDRAQLFGYIALCLIWGSTWLAIRLVVRDVPPFLAAALRFFVAGVLLLGMTVVQKRRWPAGAQHVGPRAHNNGMRFLF